VDENGIRLNRRYGESVFDSRKKEGGPRVLSSENKGNDRYHVKEMVANEGKNSMSEPGAQKLEAW
jgi:hypothetical protein